MIQDHITRRYRSQMRFYPDRPDVLVWGRWHWCPPGAEPLPFQHPFTSLSQCDRDQVACETTPVLGEVLGSNGVEEVFEDPPGLFGVHFCGEQGQWQNGVPYAQRGIQAWPDGVPQCCPRLPPDFGGIAVAGQVTDNAAGADVAAGGLGLGGLVVEGESSADALAGGLGLGGAVLEVTTGYDLVAGGLARGGFVCDMCISTITVSDVITGGGNTDTVNVGHGVSGVTPGTYGDASHVAQVDVDEYGHVTHAVDVAISLPAASVTGLAAVATSGSASDLTAGTIPAARLPGGGVNGASQLVELDAGGNLPALNGAALIGLTAAQVGAASSLSASATGVTGVSLGDVFDATIATGIHGSAGLKNTGANALVYKFTLTDVWGNTQAMGASVGLPPGGFVSWMVDSMIATLGLSNIFYPLKEVHLQVQDQAPGSHTNWQCYYSFQG